ncbi:protein transporter Sec31 [Streptomyces sp. NPDC090054]|uniref:protein transporter Sec31 n=1 Tax=Streptomyces sp. NPDC090054 TaxID=3365933 RepID=UPI00380E713A
MRTRTETRTRQVLHTVDGEAEVIDEDYQVEAPPRDWDDIALTTVTITTAVIVLASVAWSTAGIGDLLDRVAPSLAAYAAAGVFDLLWINCMILEWLTRYDPARARTFRSAGHFALAIAMAAVCLHGYIADSLEVGLVAAAVSALAKAGWTLALRAHARPLDARTQAWLVRRQARIGARLALSAQLRRLAAVEARGDGRPGPDTDPDRPDASGDRPDDVVPIRPSVRQAVENAWHSGKADSASILAYVHQVADPHARQDTVDRYLRDIRRAG